MYGSTYTTSGYAGNGSVNQNRNGMLQQRYIQQPQSGGYTMTPQQPMYRTQPGVTSNQMMSQQFKMNAYQMQFLQQKSENMGFQAKKPNLSSGSYPTQPQGMHVLQMAQQAQSMQANRTMAMAQQQLYQYNRTVQQPSMKTQYPQMPINTAQRMTPVSTPRHDPEPKEKEVKVLSEAEAPFLTNRQIIDEITGCALYRPSRIVDVAAGLNKESKVRGE